MPNSGMDMNCTVTKKQCEGRFQPDFEELGYTDRKIFVEGSSQYGLNQGYVIDVTPMNLSDDLV